MQRWRHRLQGRSWAGREAYAEAEAEAQRMFMGRGSATHHSGGNGREICLPVAGRQQVLVIFIPVLGGTCDDYVMCLVIPKNFVIQMFQYVYH